MAGSQLPSDKRQASLTSFFTPKASQQPARPTPKPATTSNDVALNTKPFTSPRSPLVSRKRLLQELASVNTNDVDPPSKRARSVAPAEDEAELYQATLFSRSPARPTPRASPPPPSASARTERYVYGAVPRSSSGAGAANDHNDDEDDEPESPETKRRRDELHKKFVKKLGHPDSMAQLRRRNWGNDGDTTLVEADEDGGGGEDDDGDEEEATHQPAKPTKRKGAKTGKLTPMELQFLDIKRQHMDTMLIVEVGYKFRFFGEDARIAAKELGIVCIPGKMRYDEHSSEAHLDRFASASIPTHRLPVHAKRLVAAGHKVGVVRQLETAALKKVGDNRNAPFTRKLTNVYTKGTYVDELGELDRSLENTASSPIGGYLLCITESKAKGWGTDEKVDVGLLAVQPATGDIIYDSFEDEFMRREIETRLLHISPCEFLIVGDLTKATDKLLQHLAGSKNNVFGDKSRVERVGKGKTLAAEAYSHVVQFYADKVKQHSQDEKTSALLDKVLKLPESVTICLSAMITHLTEYGLQHIFDLTKYFQPFSTRSHMLINGTTLESLEVYRNATDHAERGSLFWAIDKTHTRSGQRLLRKWLGMPLLDQARLEERTSAVQELLESQATLRVDKIQALLRSIKTDLERSLIRIYYGKCTRPELLAVLQTLQKIYVEYAMLKTAADTQFKSSLINEALLAIPPIGDIVISSLDKISADAARRDDKYEFFTEAKETDAISEHKLGIAVIEHDLDQHRAVAASKLGKKSPVTYVTVAGIEYLIEAPNTDVKKVPASWMKISGTKKLSRFHTPEVVRLISERDQHKEALAAACDSAFTDLLSSIAAEYQPLRDAVSALATLDCLQSLAHVATLPGYTKPTFLPSISSSSDPHPNTTISITAGRHPIAEHTLPTGYIPFTTTLSSQAPHPLAHLITGPNMGGKSSYVRAVALLVLLAQIGSYVPAESMSLTLIDAIHTRMGARDNLFKGESTFMVEVSETASILRTATPRSLVILDELGRGTSTHDGAAIAHAVLHHVVREMRCLTLFITHYQSLARVADGLGDRAVRNVHMRFTATKTNAADQSRSAMLVSEDSMEADIVDDTAEHVGDEEITFLYEVAEGVAHRSYGLNVARLARIPRDVLQLAGVKSRQMEQDTKMRRLRGAAALLDDVFRQGPGHLDQLISGIEQL